MRRRGKTAMSEDLSHAFMHPEARAAATAGAEPLDRISLRGHVVMAEIGAFQTERGVRQRIEFNIVVEVSPREDTADDVDRVMSYDRLTEAISIELASERVNLLETLAERVAGRVLGEPRAMRVFVRIEKLDRGSGALGVEIARSRGGSPGRPGAMDRRRTLCPTVVFLSGAVIASVRPTAMIDRFAEQGRPVIFCVGEPLDAAPLPEDPKIRKRIGLLAIERTAWSLSARDPRFVVADTRTELDWALNNGRIPVWAPSKMVLATVRAPEAGSDDPLGLAVWFAGRMDAGELVTVGVAPPAGLGIPSRESSLESVG